MCLYKMIKGDGLTEKGTLDRLKKRLKNLHCKLERSKSDVAVIETDVYTAYESGFDFGLREGLLIEE